MKIFSFAAIAILISIFMTACTNAGTQTPPVDTTGTTAEQANTPNIPTESSDEYDLNMKNARLNLDLVE